MNIPPPLLEVCNLRKRYGDFALSDVTFSVHPGEVVGLIGRNGAGKTTVIKMTLGLIDPDAGDGNVLGTPIRDMSRQTGTTTKEDIGVVLDSQALPDTVRIRDLAGLMPSCYGTWDAPMFDGLLRHFGISGAKTVKELSRGTGMKLSLACALSHHPRLLILDEATAGLDPMARDEALAFLRRFMEGDGHGILMSSHITSDLDGIADRIICIDAGHVIFDKPKDEITDMMGIARCHTRDVDAITSSDIFGTGMEPMILSHDYGVDIAVPNRFAFAERFPDTPCDRMTIDKYMRFVLKGEKR